MFRLIRGRKWGRREFERLLKNISEGIVVHDDQGKIVFVNEAAANLLAIPLPMVILGRPIKSIFNKYKITDEHGKNVRVSALPPFSDFRKNGEHKGSFQFISNKSTFWLRVRSNAIKNDIGEIEYIATAFRDVTSGKENERELTFRRELLEAQSEATMQGVLAVDKNQQALYVNSRLAQMLAVDITKLVGKTVSDLFDVGKDSILEFDKFSRKALIVGKSKTRKAKGLFQTKSGKYISYYTVPLNDKAGNFLARVWFFDDKTYEIKADQEREAFISIATHELRNPLTTVRGYVELLTKRVGKLKEASAKNYLDRLLLQVDKVVDLVDDLLDLSQIRSGAMVLRHNFFDMDQLLNEVIDDFKKSTNRKIHKSGSAKSKVYGDKKRIRQVIVNLISNALKYSSEKSLVNVSVKQEKNTTTVSVKDLGMGIKEKERARIFDLFVRGKSKRKMSGHGIGLFLSQAIVRGHNGKIWVDSKYGHGSTFSFIIPTTPTNSRSQAKIFR